MSALNGTAFDHIKGSGTFTITAAETWSIAMIRKLKARYPAQVNTQQINPDGSMVVHLPFERMRIAPKRQDTQTDEQRKARAERMKLLNLRLRDGGTSPISEDRHYGSAGIPHSHKGRENA